MIRPEERATLAFYQWEYRTRGYYVFNDIVDIEPPYVPFVPVTAKAGVAVDDGRVPSLFDRIEKFFAPKREEPKVETPITHEVISAPKLTSVKIIFPPGEEISQERTCEVVRLLTSTWHPINFEIVAQKGLIELRITTARQDVIRVHAQLKAFFPRLVIAPAKTYDFAFNFQKDIAICDFGLENESMLPVSSREVFALDPLTSIIATLGTISPDEVAVLQIMYKGVLSPWSGMMNYAISDGNGGCFFPHEPEFVPLCKQKTKSTLFATVMRLAVQGNTNNRSSDIAMSLAQTISLVSASPFNRVIPLSNKGYSAGKHLRNFYHRTSNRTGFLLNLHELVHFIHYPNKTVVHPRLGVQSGKTKRLQVQDQPAGIIIGQNMHHDQSIPVVLDTVKRTSHTHVIGATGVGKSTLLANMILQDIKLGHGLALFDPHGDIVDDILHRIPEERIQDVVIIDPSDIKYPIGFNLLHADTEAERIVLSSDLVSAFKRHASAWGDNMTAVLQNAVNTVLDSTRGGTLIELKRFLIEDDFRNEFLLSVDDPSIHYYWNNEYPMVRKGISSLLTRIDTFLRPKIIRYMLAQRTGIDLKVAMAKNHIVLVKLSQGLIGEDNSYLLGSLLLAKFNQVAMSRQALAKDQRKPFFLYLDEFQNFITPSISKILSGARKYGLGLTLAHQELGQMEEQKLLNSVLSNPHIRICFRLGDSDAKKLEQGFSYFESTDLQSLGRGEAIMRIGSSSNDFNLKTKPLPDVSEASDRIAKDIVENVRATYCSTQQDVEDLLASMLPDISGKEKSKKTSNQKAPTPPPNPQPKAEKTIDDELPDFGNDAPDEDFTQVTPLEIQKEKILQEATEKEQETQHRSLQNFVRTVGMKRGYVGAIEKKVSNGRIDVTLEKDGKKIAVEISVTNTLANEVGNIQKCLSAGYEHVYMVCENKTHLINIKKRTQQAVSKEDFKKVSFGNANDFVKFLDSREPKPSKKAKRIRGYRVKSKHIDIDQNDAQARDKALRDIILESSKNKPKKDE